MMPEPVKEQADRTVTIMAAGREIARGEFHRPDVDTAPCMFCQGNSNCCFEVHGSHPGKIFTCDNCSQILLAKDIMLRMPWRPEVSSVTVTMDGEDMGSMGVDTVPPGGKTIPFTLQ